MIGFLFVNKAKKLTVFSYMFVSAGICCRKSSRPVDLSPPLQQLKSIYLLQIATLKLSIFNEYVKID
jgi:hypothetical protein